MVSFVPIFGVLGGVVKCEGQELNLNPANAEAGCCMTESTRQRFIPEASSGLGLGTNPKLACQGRAQCNSAETSLT